LEVVETETHSCGCAKTSRRGSGEIRAGQDHGGSKTIASTAEAHGVSDACQTVRRCQQNSAATGASTCAEAHACAESHRYASSGEARTGGREDEAHPDAAS
jgi:hypothetical protein